MKTKPAQKTLTTFTIYSVGYPSRPYVYLSWRRVWFSSGDRLTLPRHQGAARRLYNHDMAVVSEMQFCCCKLMLLSFITTLHTVIY